MLNNAPHTNTLSGGGTPEFQPLSQRGHDPIFGLSRSAYYQLEKAGEIRLIRIRKPGNIQGRVLIDCNSVRKYFAKLARQQQAGRGGAKDADPAAEIANAVENHDTTATTESGVAE